MQPVKQAAAQPSVGMNEAGAASALESFPKARPVLLSDVCPRQIAAAPSNPVQSLPQTANTSDLQPTQPLNADLRHNEQQRAAQTLQSLGLPLGYSPGRMSPQQPATDLDQPQPPSVKLESVQQESVARAEAAREETAAALCSSINQLCAALPPGAAHALRDLIVLYRRSPPSTSLCSQLTQALQHAQHRLFYGPQEQLVAMQLSEAATQLSLAAVG